MAKLNSRGENMEKEVWVVEITNKKTGLDNVIFNKSLDVVKEKTKSFTIRKRED